MKIDRVILSQQALQRPYQEDMMSLTSHLFLVSFNFPLCFRLQLNVICSINFLRDNSHLIFYWQLKIMIESPHYLAQGLQNEHNQCNEVINDKNKALSSNIQFVVLCRKRSPVPFFLKSNCLPLPSIFFRDCSYLLYDINRQTAPVSILNQFVKTSQIHNYRTRSVSSDSFYVKFSRTDKMYAFFTRIGAQIWNSIPYSIKILKRSSFRKK